MPRPHWCTRKNRKGGFRHIPWALLKKHMARCAFLMIYDGDLPKLLAGYLSSNLFHRPKILGHQHHGQALEFEGVFFNGSTAAQMGELFTHYICLVFG